MKKRTSRLVAITLVLVLSMIPVMALAAATDVAGQLPDPEDAAGARWEDDSAARPPFEYERVPKPEEPAKEPEKQPEKQPERQPERQPEEPQEDPGRIVTERFIRLIETGRGFEELWSNRESPVWTLGDIENYLSRRAGRIPTAGVGFIAHP